APVARDLRGEAYGGDDGRLLHRHRDEELLAIDEEVEADAHRQAEDAHGVLDHRVGIGDGEGARLTEAAQLVAIELELLGEAPEALRHAHFVEAWEPASPHPLLSLWIVRVRVCLVDARRAAAIRPNRSRTPQVAGPL